jgi:DNA-binding GntR family transcriptional regulator
LAKKSFINLVDAGQEASGYRTLIERTYGQLREDILDGKLIPGEKLLVEHLKSRYDVGAGTVREALSRLVSEAMVVAEGQRGFTVAPVSVEDLLDVTNVRVAIETDALRASVRNGDEFWRNRLRIAFEKVTDVELPLKDEAVRLWEQANMEFHGALLSACGSPWALRMVHQLTQHAERYRRFSIGLHGGRDVHSEHQQIFDAAMAGQDARAALALEAHIRATPEMIVNAIRAGKNIFDLPERQS